MNAITKQETAAVPALAMTEHELMTVLQNSLYPGAQPESIKLVIGYCKAAGLDPMQKPVHIVPIWDSKARMLRDVVMPGIGLYRTQAARGGQYAGVTEPEFGPDVHDSLGGQNITYPSWCRVTVKRLLPNGQIAEFTATERWLENYAQKGGQEKSIAPNAMWTRRPYAQLAKCAEAQALRKAFPEFGAQPTADEMEGKEIDMGAAEVVTGTPRQPEKLPEYPADQFSKNLSSWKSLIQSGKKTPEGVIATVSSRYTLTEAQRLEIEAMAKQSEGGNPEAMTYAQVSEALNTAGDLDTLDLKADLINRVENEAHREELSRTYHDLRSKLEG